MNAAVLSATQLRTEAKARLAQAHVDRHWSVIAAILRRVDQEKLYLEYERHDVPGAFFDSTQQWAEEELGLDGFEVMRYLQGADLMAQAPQISPEAWRSLSASQLREIRRVVNLGGDVLEWVGKATVLKTTEALRGEISKYLDPASQVFMRFGFRAPAASIVLYEAAMVLALDEATGQPGTPKARIHHPDTAFRCWDVIVGGWVSSIGQHQVEAEELLAVHPDLTPKGDP